jgi:hypothetical protein
MVGDPLTGWRCATSRFFTGKTGFFDICNSGMSLNKAFLKQSVKKIR